MENVTGPWVTNTRSTSSLLYRGPSTPGTSGSVLNSLGQPLHLLLRPDLEEHENKDHEGQTAELTESRVLVSRYAVQGEGHLFYEHAGAIDDGSHDSKLGTNLEEGHPLWLGFVQFWCKIVNKSGNEERKDEAKDTNPRDAQCPNEVMLGHHLLVLKKKVLDRLGRVPRGSNNTIG